MIEKDLAKLAVDTALKLGASYADARIIHLQSETIDIRNQNVSGLKKWQGTVQFDDVKSTSNPWHATEPETQKWYGLK